MKNLKTLLIFIIFSLGTNSFAVTLEEKINFLILQKDYYNIIQKINLKHLSFYIKCLKNEKTVFQLDYLDKYGQVTTRSIPCLDVKSRIFDNRLKLDYEKMRLFLALSSPARRDELHTMSISNKLHFKINININHPNDTSLTNLPFDVQKPEPLSKAEIKKAMRIYNKYTKKMCNFYKAHILRKKLNNISKYNMNKELSIDDIQNNFCKGPDLSKGSSLFLDEYINILKNYHQWLENSRFEFRKKYLELYYNQINKTPYFLLIKTTTPSSDELIMALKAIEKNAIEKKKDFDDYTDDHAIEEVISDYKNGYLSNFEKEELFEKLAFYINDLVFIRFYQSFEKDLHKETKEKIDEHLSYTKTLATIKEVSIIVGGLATCFLPTQKIFKALNLLKPIKLSKIFRLSCFTTLGLPLNSWFIHDSLKKYETAIKELLLSADGRFILRKYNTISKSDLILNTLFITSGVGAGKSLVKAIKGY